MPAIFFHPTNERRSENPSAARTKTKAEAERDKLLVRVRPRPREHEQPHHQPQHRRQATTHAEARLSGRRRGIRGTGGKRHDQRWISSNPAGAKGWAKEEAGSARSMEGNE